jgi:hypothetical protein
MFPYQGQNDKMRKMEEAFSSEQVKEKVYPELEKMRFQHLGQQPNDYVEFYLSGFATVQCAVRDDMNEVHIERYYDNERFDDKRFVKKIPIPTDGGQIFVDKIVNICALLKQGITGDESIFGGMDDVNEETEPDADVDMVEYVSQRTGENPFTLKTPNGQEKFEYVNAKYPSGKIDIAVYAFRGDITYGYNHFRKMFNISEGKEESYTDTTTLDEVSMKQVYSLLVAGYVALHSPGKESLQSLLHSPAGRKVVQTVKNEWDSFPQAQRTIDNAQELWSQALAPMKVEDPNQPLPSEKNMNASDLAQKYADRDADVAQKTSGFVNKYLNGKDLKEIKYSGTTPGGQKFTGDTDDEGFPKPYEFNKPKTCLHPLGFQYQGRVPNTGPQICPLCGTHKRID